MRDRTSRKLHVAAERVQPCLALVNDVRQAVLDGLPLNRVLLLLDELQHELLNVEDAVGVVTPATLFQ